MKLKSVTYKIYIEPHRRCHHHVRSQFKLNPNQLFAPTDQDYSLVYNQVWDRVRRPVNKLVGPVYSMIDDQVIKDNQDIDDEA